MADTTYGLLSTGLVVKPQDQIIADMETDGRSRLGASVPFGDGTLLGHLIRIVSEPIAKLWELAEAVYAAFNPDAATGAALVNLCAITGTPKDPAKPSTDVLTLTGDAASTIPAGAQASTLSTGKRFATLADATIAALIVWVGTTVYALGDRRTNASRAYECITPGTSAGSGGPTTTAADITDGTAHWRYIGEGVGAVDVKSACTVDGATVAISGDITVIETPYAGWSSVINLLDADLGQLEETDEDLRIKRELELARSGASTPDAIRADLLEVADVISATVFHNDTDATDGNGLPPHSVECLVRGGDDQAIADQVFASVAAGIATYGSTTKTVTDSEGVAQTVDFSRPTLENIYVVGTVTYDATLYPSDGDAQIKAAIVAFGDLQKTGKDVVATSLIAQCFKVPGVLDVTPMYIGLAPSPVSSVTIVISARQLAVFDTSRITITSSPGTP